MRAYPSPRGTKTAVSAVAVAEANATVARSTVARRPSDKDTNAQGATPKQIQMVFVMFAVFS